MQRQHRYLLECGGIGRLDIRVDTCMGSTELDLEVELGEVERMVQTVERACEESIWMGHEMEQFYVAVEAETKEGRARDAG